MGTDFQYDVFLSHNSADKPRVRNLAERLKQVGLRVWFDEWVIKAGDDIYLAIERGLEAARVQVLCLSPAALGSEWVALERSTVLFRDPTNKGRRFVPLLLADSALPDTLRRYKYVDFRQESPAAFDELLAACRVEAESVPPASQPEAEEETGEGEAEAGEAPEQAEPLAVLERKLTGTRTGSTAWPSARMEPGRRRVRTTRRSRFGTWRRASAGRRWKGIRGGAVHRDHAGWEASSFRIRRQIDSYLGEAHRPAISPTRWPCL